MKVVKEAMKDVGIKQVKEVSTFSEKLEKYE